MNRFSEEKRVNINGVENMLQAIIDIGSNSIRLAIYKIENEKVELLMNKKEIARLAAYVVNGFMNSEGIEKACYVLKDFKNLLDNLQINNVIAFATAAIRNAHNSNDIVKAIKHKTGLKVIVLSGAEEARLGFIGAIKDIKNTAGVMADIGGGSTEIVTYHNSQIKHAISLPLGALNVTKAHVKGILPTVQECNEIKKAVLAELKKNEELLTERYDIFGGIGGTLRGTCKINNYLFKATEKNRIITTKNIKKIIDILVADNTENFVSKNTLHLLLSTVPERVETILPGMVILVTLLEYFATETVILSDSGVREGYIDKYILN